MTVATESTPLLSRKKDINNDILDQQRPIHILMEIMGAHDLCLERSIIRPYCVVRFGSRQVLHRTKPAVATATNTSSIWTVATNSLCTFCIFSPAEQRRGVLWEKKKLEVAVWAKVRSSTSRLSPTKTPPGSNVVFLGKIQVDTVTVLNNCNEERMEFNLKDDVGRDVADSTLAVRFRIASREDVLFVRDWKFRHGLGNSDDVLQQKCQDEFLLGEEDGQNDNHKPEDTNRPLPTLVTEMNEGDVSGARLLTNMTNKTTTTASAGRGKVVVKPGPDPKRPQSTTLMTPAELKAETEKPSQDWVEAGSGSVGRLYLEILSCHSLPNIDYGTSAVGNVTDAFCCAVYEDAMVQTPVISDELSPHWMPWTQRAVMFHITRPSSSVLYLAVFGYKRRLFHHNPIGRVEINTGNIQRNTTHDLVFNLSPSSHVTDRRVRGTIRVRLRLEYDNERAALLSVLRPPPRVYINVNKKKSFRVARYTCLGEYYGKEKFSWTVLLAYKDEIEKYLRRILFGTADAFRSLVFWKGQVQVFSIWLPLHSLVFFSLGVLLIERPSMLPAILLLVGAWFMLACMLLRLNEPSPWNRCLSFWHYITVLFYGESSLPLKKIDSQEGWEETLAREKAWKKRMKRNHEELKKREALEKMIDEIGDDDIQTDIQPTSYVLPNELMLVLGKLQGIVGEFLRLCRLVDAVVTWEESAMSFWITVMLLIAGMVSLFVPWAFILKWTARILFWGLCGPHMKLVDNVGRRRHHKDENYRHLRVLLQKEICQARIRREEAVKLKAVRSHMFGKFITQVPALIWTPHNDRPNPDSTARLDLGWVAPTFLDTSPLLPGQQLYGVMVPRLREDWLRNHVISETEMVRVKRRLLKRTIRRRTQSPILRVKPDSDIKIQDEDVRDEGIEVADILDEEGGIFVKSVLFKKPATDLEDSFVEPGVEISDIYKFDEEARITEQLWSERFDDEFDFGTSNVDNDEDDDVNDGGVLPDMGNQLAELLGDQTTSDDANGEVENKGSVESDRMISQYRELSVVTGGSSQSLKDDPSKGGTVVNDMTVAITGSIPDLGGEAGETMANSLTRKKDEHKEVLKKVTNDGEEGVEVTFSDLV